MLTAFVLIHAEPNRIAEIAQEIANLPSVAEVYSVTGEFDIVAVVRLPEYEQLAEAVPEGLAKTFDPDGKRKQQQEAMNKLREAPDRKAWAEGVIAYLEKFPELLQELHELRGDRLIDHVVIDGP